MSIETDRNKLSQLRKVKVQIESNLTRERNNIRDKSADINSISRSITKNTSASTLQSKQKQIEAKEKQLSSYEKKVVDLEKKLAEKNTEILKVLSNIEKTEAQAQKKKDNDDKKKMDTELRHKREMTRELEKQSRLHTKLSSNPITIEFASLPEKITVLFIASNPTDQNQLRLDEEIRLITKKIREAEYRDAVELKSVWAVRPTDLLQAINEHKPTIVHFSGHGSDNDELMLQDDLGNTKLVSLSSIVEMFKVVASGIKLVVFNTCFSENSASEIVEHISAAIGMNTSIGDQAARIFSAQLYSAISFGKDIEESFNQAKVALMLENILEEKIPQLFIEKDTNVKNLILVKPENI